MKRWLNNWEKNIGGRLRDARNLPEDHVWDLIEQDLDSIPANRRTAAYRAAGLAALLLLVSATALWMRTPTSQMAGQNGFGFSGTGDAGKWVIADIPPSINPGVSNSTALAGLKGNVTLNIMDEEYPQDLNNAAASVETAEMPTAEAPPEADATATASLEVFQPNEAVTESLQPNSSIMAPGEESDRPGAETATGEVTDRSFNSYTTEMVRMNRLASETTLENQLLVRFDPPALNAYLTVSKLSMHTGYILQGLDEGPGLETPSGFAGREMPTTFADPGETSLLAEVDITVRPEAEVKEEMSWMDEAGAEFEEWKASLEAGAEEDASSLAALVEEAILDEEDPLTRRQNETLELYRSHNINKGFHVGTVTAFQASWVTRASRNQEVDRSDVEYRFNPGYQVGINMGYDITEHFGLMMELKYSDEGGRYFDPSLQREQEIDLRYVEVPLIAKIKHSTLSDKMRPLVFNYLVGVTYSDLRKVSAVENGVDKRFAQGYNTSEWGLTAGFDFDFYINKNFFWTVGSRVGVNGNAKSFPKLKGEDGTGPMSIDAGLYTRINFRLPGK